MAYGMSWEQFWYEDPWMVRAFAQTFLLKQKLRNEYAWIQGAYIANAFASVLATSFGKKKVDYLNKPLDLYPKTKHEQEEEKRQQRLKLIRQLNLLKTMAKKKDTGVNQDGNT